MKRLISTVASALALGALATGCGPNPKATLAEDTGAELTANDLACLQDFHVWKLPVPSSQQPLKGVKLVLAGADGTGVQLFGTANSDPAPAWTNILLGFRYKDGVFAGRLEGRGAKTGETYSLNFTNASTVRPRSWAQGSRWTGNRAELATFWRSEEAAKSGGNDYSTLTIQLVK